MLVCPPSTSQVYSPACEVCGGEKVRVRMVVVAMRMISATVIAFPEEIDPDGPSHWAEGMLVRPEMTSRTVQVRVSSPLPASTAPSTEASVTTSRAPGGTRRGAVSSLL